MKIIDVHSHMLLPSYLEGLKELEIDPLKEDGFPTPKWEVEQHIEYMKEMGIEKSILSLSTPHIHNGNAKKAIELARKINDDTAKICKEYPQYFRFAACIPLPEIEASIEEIRRAYDKLGAIAIKVPSNGNGIYLGDPILDAVFEELNKRNAIVIMHPSRPQAVPTNVFTEGPAPLFEYLGDSTRAVINMLVNGTLEKYPNIKFIVPHTGAFFALIKNRLVGISKVLIPNGLMPNVDIESSFKKLYFDNAGDTNNIALDALLKVCEPSHILFGTDYPYTPKFQIKQKIDEFIELNTYCEDIMYNNTKELFKF